MTAAPRRVLVVDDNNDFAAVVVTAVERHGLSVRVAANGLKAIELCGEFAPDTIVLDIVMPEMDGMEFIAWLAQSNYHARLIIVSAHSRYTDLAEKMADIKGLTITAVLPKPVRLPVLMAAINT
jgi:two-component system OmpR family response regulator